MNNIRQLKDIGRVGQAEQFEIDKYWHNMMGKVGCSFTMGISFGTGALLSFYILKHYLMNKTE